MEKEAKHPEYQYLDLLQNILDNGVEQVDLGTGVKTYSVLGKQMRFDLSKGFPLLTTKRVYWKGVLYELFWFMKGMNNIKYLVDNNVHIWDDYPFRLYNKLVDKGEVPKMTKEEFIDKIHTDNEFAEKHGTLKHIYGEMWRSWPAKDGRKVDQLKWLMNEIVKDPNCHNAIINSWDPQYLYDMANPDEALRFPICHNMFQVSIREGKVCLHLYQRSADIFLGVPFNIASYALLAQVIAHLTGYGVGEFIHTFGDVHIYENQFDQVKEQLSRSPRKFPMLKISEEATTLENIAPEHITLENYDPHSLIKADLNVVGGYVEKDRVAFEKKD
jgi:thymidylate synthase